MNNQVIAGRFELTGTIGQGGMGDVYRGIDRQTGDTVAIKLLKPDIVDASPDLIARFEREGEALRQLNHPNIVKMLAAVKEDELHYLVIEYVSGGSLRDLLNETPQLPIQRALEIALDVADALTRAHRLNILHRDIKPANVLLAEDGTPRLTDFGVARLGNRTRLTETGSVIGTVAYLSPEGCKSADLDARTDVWSFGVMLYEMIAGRRPFEHPTVAAMVYAVVNEDAPDLREFCPDAPPALADLLSRMLAKECDQRVRSIRQVGAELENILYELDAPADHAPRATPPPAHGHSRFATLTPTHDESGPVIVMPTPPPDDPTHQITPPRARKGPPPGPIRLVLLAVIVGVIALAAFGAFVLLGSDSGDDTPDVMMVEPVADDELMVLIAQLEPLDGVTERDVTRFIVEDLTEQYENLPQSTVRVREYPAIITTDKAARAAAEANHAPVIVWGDYTPTGINLKIQVGDTRRFPYLKFDDSVVTRTANLRVSITNERTESIAMPVMLVLNVLYTADGDMLEVARMNTILDDLQATGLTSPTVTSATVATDLLNLSAAYLVDSEQALAHINHAIERDPGNALLYSYRCAIHIRRGDIDLGTQDCATAELLGPDDWTMPLAVLGTRGYATGDFANSIDYYERVVAARPDEWYPLNFLGAIYYLSGDYDRALTYLEQAIALHPDFNFPYIFAISVAMRQARFEDARAYIETILADYPDPAFSNRIVATTLSGDEIFGPSVAAGGYLYIGQYADVIPQAEAALAINDQLPDMYLALGYAQCNLGDYAAAEAAYTDAIALEPDYMTVYLLRAEVRLKQGDMAGSVQDTQTVLASDQSDMFAPYIEAAMAGDLSCENFLTAPLLEPEAEGGS